MTQKRYNIPQLSLEGFLPDKKTILSLRTKISGAKFSPNELVESIIRSPHSYGIRSIRNIIEKHFPDRTHYSSGMILTRQTPYITAFKGETHKRLYHITFHTSFYDKNIIWGGSVESRALIPKENTLILKAKEVKDLRNSRAFSSEQITTISEIIQIEKKEISYLRNRKNICSEKRMNKPSVIIYPSQTLLLEREIMDDNVILFGQYSPKDEYGIISLTYRMIVIKKNQTLAIRNCDTDAFELQKEKDRALFYFNKGTDCNYTGSIKKDNPYIRIVALGPGPVPLIIEESPLYSIKEKISKEHQRLIYKGKKGEFQEFSEKVFESGLMGL